MHPSTGPKPMTWFAYAGRRGGEDKQEESGMGEEELGYKLIVIHGVIPRGKRLIFIRGSALDA